MKRGGKFWKFAWKIYDTRWMVCILPNRIAPWMFGMMIGSKGKRIK